MLKQADGSAQKLVHMLTTEIASFNDVTQFEGEIKTAVLSHTNLISVCVFHI